MSLMKHARGMAVLLAAGLLGGAVVSLVQPWAAASAEQVLLPPIFQEGATLLSPVGRIEIKEIQGAWIRVKSLHPLAASDPDAQWMYVPAIQGTWIPEDAMPADTTR
ncbi:MAG: hypothetical protein IT364_09185 [Candidatus Hydrogenedentes bacterium]|nr:hypothetical protein [Candidatus Hydrogenedentota bacterium]